MDGLVTVEATEKFLRDLEEDEGSDSLLSEVEEAEEDEESDSLLSESEEAEQDIQFAFKQIEEGEETDFEETGGEECEDEEDEEEEEEGEEEEEQGEEDEVSEDEEEEEEDEEFCAAELNAAADQSCLVVEATAKGKVMAVSWDWRETWLVRQSAAKRRADSVLDPAHTAAKKPRMTWKSGILQHAADM